MAPRKPPKILLDTDPLAPAVEAALPAADEALLLPTATSSPELTPEPTTAVVDAMSEASAIPDASAEATVDAAEGAVLPSTDAMAAGLDEASSAAGAAATSLAETVSDAAETATATVADTIAAAAETIESAADAGRARARMEAALDVPRLMGGFLERQARRTMDGTVGLARCRSLPDALQLQGSLIRESMDDFVRSNTDIAFRSLAALTGRSTTVC